MYNSPTTPAGTSRSDASSTHQRVPAIGDPNVTGAPAVTSSTADQTVVSVGPYMFQTGPARCTNAAANDPGRASPPHRARNPGDPAQPSSTSICHVAGV